jgi:glutamate-1-semialdehyde aminotransferase
MDGIKEILDQESKYHFAIQGVPGVFWFAKTEKDRIYNYRELMTTVDFDYMDKLSVEMINRGILKDISTNEPSMMLSFSHTDEDIQRTLDALRESIRVVEK